MFHKVFLNNLSNCVDNKLSLKLYVQVLDQRKYCYFEYYSIERNRMSQQ